MPSGVDNRCKEKGIPGGHCYVRTGRLSVLSITLNVRFVLVGDWHQWAEEVHSKGILGEFLLMNEGRINGHRRCHV